MKHSVVIYHAHCLDGTAAAWAAWRYLRDKADYLPSLYQRPQQQAEQIEMLRDKVVYMVDFCYPPDVMLQALEVARAIVVLDHHVSSIKALEPLKTHPRLVMQHATTEMSGAAITWKYFFDDVRKSPVLLQAIADRDIWAFKLPNTREICAFMQAQEYSIENYDRLMLRNWDEFNDTDLFAGSLLYKQHMMYVEQLERLTIMAPFGSAHGLFPLVNANGMFSSELGNALVAKHGIGIVWYRGYDKIKISVRSSDKALSAIDLVSQFGGGGHRNAAGCEIKLDTPEAKTFMRNISKGTYFPRAQRPSRA